MKKTICAVILSLTSIVFCGCAAMQDSKNYEMKKSPCACMDYYIA